MAQVSFEVAKREQARLRLGIMGASGSGKTLGALKVAKGIASSMEKVFVIDTEHGSAALYSGPEHGLKGYKCFTMKAPFLPIRYVEAVQAAEAAGAEVIVIDSASHAWEGEGGSLDQVDKKGGNSYTAWKDVTPQHRQFVEAILQSNCHLIVTLRSKQEYVLEEQTNRNGKTVQVPVRKGMAPIMRAGFEYEMTVFIDVREDHHCMATKDRTSTLDGKLIQLSEQVGAGLKKWLDSGEAAAPQAPVIQRQPEPSFAQAEATYQAVVNHEAPAPYHPDTNDDPFTPNSISESLKLAGEFHKRIVQATKKSQGAQLWDEVNKAAALLGKPTTTDLLNQLKAKAPTLSAE